MMPCKECSRARFRGKARSDAQKARDATRAKRPDVREQSRARAANWYASEHGKQWMREHGAKRYAENGEAMRAANRERYRTNESTRESIRRSSLRRRARPEVREAKNKAHAAYKKSDRGRLLGRLHAHLRRVRLKSTVCDLTDAHWLALVEAYGHRCAYCDQPCSPTVDHVQALSLGGAHTLGNVLPACGSCNRRKCTLPLPAALKKLNVNRVDFLKRQGLALFTMLQGV
jgi:HNH endonuclease